MTVDIKFQDFDRVTDTLMYFNSKMTLDFVVLLSKKNLQNNRQFFHTEIIYKSDRYAYNEYIRSIKRNINYYFAINNKEYFTEGILLRQQDVEVLLALIDRKIMPWFFGTKNEMAYKIVHDKLVLTQFEEVVYAQNENKFIKFSPIIYEFEDGRFAQGIQMGFRNGEVVQLELDRFMGFIGILKTDMYCAALSIYNYAKIPPYGVNEFRLEGLGASPNNIDSFEPPINSNNGKDNKNNNFLNNLK